MATKANNHRVLLLVMAALFAVMAVVLLSQRLNNPSITHQSHNRGGMEQPPPAEQANLLGNLMREVQQNPNNLPALIHLSEHLMSAQQWDAAEQFARRAHDLAPKEPQPMHLLAVILHNKGQQQQAAELLENLIKINDDPLARYSLGVLYIHYLKNPSKGVEHLTEGLHNEQAPEDVKALIRKELETAPLSSEAHKAKDGAAPQVPDTQKDAPAAPAKAPASRP